MKKLGARLRGVIALLALAVVAPFVILMQIMVSTVEALRDPFWRDLIGEGIRQVRTGEEPE